MSGSVLPALFFFLLITCAVDPPVIDVQPMDQVDVPEGENVDFSVTATGVSLTYQWQKSEVNINDAAGTYSGTNTDTLTVESVTKPDDEGSFRVVVSNNAGNVNSEPAMLSVCKCPHKNFLLLFSLSTLHVFHISLAYSSRCN